MVRFIRKLKLEFPSLNGLLHCILTYLRGEIALVPGAASIPEGTSIELNLTYPDADEPVIVRGVSQGLDPAGRGLRLRLDNPQEVDQVTMLLGHLHLGPYAARKLMAFVRQQQDNKPRLLSQVSPVPSAPTTSPDADGQATSEEARNLSQSSLRQGTSKSPERSRSRLAGQSFGWFPFGATERPVHQFSRHGCDLRQLQHQALPCRPGGLKCPEACLRMQERRCRRWTPVGATCFAATHSKSA